MNKWTLIPAVVVFALINFADALTPRAKAETLVIGIRDHEQETARLCAAMGECRLIKSNSAEFANGNTFVRFEENCLGHDVVLNFPKTLTADQFMESLIKLRTARQQGARSVTVLSSVDPQEVVVKDNERKAIPIEIAELISVAGADSWQKGNHPPRPLKKQIKNHNQHGVQPSTSAVYIAGDFHSKLRDQLAKELELPVLNGQSPLTLRGSHVFMVAPSHDPVNETFLKVLAKIQHYRTYGIAVSLITPYKLYARSDKRDQNGIIITGRLIADLIEVIGTKTITFVRLHAPQSEGFFSIPTFHVTGRETINAYLKAQNIDMVVSPDTGAQKEVTLYAEEIGVPIAVINKQRDPLTSATTIHGISGDSVAGKVIAVIDDETASGGTLADTAAYLKKAGAKKVIGVVTHLAGNAAKAIVSDDLEQLVVTDTLPVDGLDPNKILVLPIGKEIADKIRGLRNAVSSGAGCQKLFKE
jgi:ribose-phosphate pyrophosphokinase